MTKNRFRFCTLLPSCKRSHGLQTGTPCGPQNATEGRATAATFCDSQNGFWPASSPTAGDPWQASGRGSDSSVVKIVASISSPQRCGPDATRQRPSPDRCRYLWPRRTAFPKRIAVEARRPARCSTSQSSGADVHPPPISVPRSVPFAECLHSSRAIGQVYLQESRGSGFQSQVCKRPHPRP